MPTIPIVPETVAAVPFAITPSNVTEAKLIAAYAEWDGTGASGNFLPCLAIYSDAGVRLGRVFPSSPVTAGDKAVVTYAPFPGGIGKSSAAGSGIQFDTDNEGGWLDVTTNNIDPGGWGMQLIDKTAGGILVHADATAGIVLQADQANNAGVTVDTNGAANVGFVVQTAGLNNDGMDVTLTGNGNGGFACTITGTGNGGFSVSVANGGGFSFDMAGGGNFHLGGLPTINPGGAGNVWNNAGVLNIT